MLPAGLFGGLGKQKGGPKRHRNASLDILKKLPGSVEWTFSCMNVHTAIATLAAMNNITPSVPSFYQVAAGYEAVITWVQIGPNIVPSSGGVGSWAPGLTLNLVPVPGWYPISTLPGTDGMGNWWADCEIYVEENSLVNLIKWSDTLGAGNPADIGGTVHGYTWPIRSRLTWEATHGRSPSSGD